MVINCLSSLALKNYLRGGSSDVDVQTIESHIAVCKSCQQLLEQLADESESELPWLAHAQPAKMLVATQSAGSRSFERTGESLAESTSRGLGSEVSKTMDTIRDYKIIEVIGQGGMGTVYRALHLRLNRLVALKILKSDRLESFEANSRFTREMRLLAQLEHPQIVRALDAGEFEGQQYFVMEFVPGIDLGQFIRRLGPIPVSEACEVIRQAAGALQYAHDHKILHRDVKPSNLMIMADGNVKLLDLGLAQLLDKGESSVTEADQAVGTFAYMAPETLYGNGTASAQSDIFSLGVTLFQMLTGMRPFERPGTPVLIPDLTAMRPDVSPELNALVYQMIAADPADRPRSMQEVERLFKALTDAPNLPSLVAEYFRWGNRVSQRTLSRQSGLVPPPVQSSRARPLRKGSWLEKIPIVAGIAVVAVSIGYATFKWTGQSKQKEIAPRGSAHADRSKVDVIPEPIVATTGTLKILPHGDFASQLLAEGRIYLFDAEKLERYTLDTDDLQLPLGKYTLAFDSPVALFEKGQVVEVFSGKNQLNVFATLTYPFQFPTLPPMPGGYASYYGTIWREGWEKGEPTTFDLSLEMLPDSNLSGKNRTRWIKLVAKLPQDDYCETAYFQIDELRWLRDHQLEISEGFVQPTGRAITQFCELLPEHLKNDTLVLPLDAEIDQIAEIAGLDLPVKRISTQDFLSLFFGAVNITAAAEQIRSLRIELAKPGSRNAWLDDIDNGTGSVSCYVVSSRQKAELPESYGYSMARRDAELFGFVQLEVNSPSIVATCMLKSQTPQSHDALINHQLIIEGLRQSVGNPGDWKPAEPPSQPPKSPSIPSNTKFDLAVMPDEPSSVTWRGSIARGNRPEDLQVTASMLWKGDIDGRECRWLEIEVESTLNGRVHWEGARLLVDSESYELRSEFKILQGWIAFDELENVFPFPGNGDVDSLIDKRLQRQINTTFDQVGIVDVLAMLFGADLKPKSTIGTLRSKLSGILAGSERKPVAEERYTKLGLIEGVLWKPPLGSIVQYEFFRSTDVPFGFVSVSLKVPLLIDIGLEAHSHGPISATHDSLFGSADVVRTAVINNQKQIAANDLPNWRVWSWTHKMVDYKVYAEYAGDIEAGSTPAYPKFVLLADATGKIIRVPNSDLSAPDRAYADEGRVWATSKIKQKLLQDDERTGTLSLTWRTNTITRYYELASMIQSDRAWVNRLRSIKRNRQTLEQAEKDWKDFATFSRP